jgi:hypothetical protein
VPAASRTELQNVDLVTFRVHASARDSLFPYASMHDTVMARHAAMSGFPPWLQREKINWNVRHPGG